MPGMLPLWACPGWGVGMAAVVKTGSSRTSNILAWHDPWILRASLKTLRWSCLRVSGTSPTRIFANISATHFYLCWGWIWSRWLSHIPSFRHWERWQGNSEPFSNGFKPYTTFGCHSLFGEKTNGWTAFVPQHISPTAEMHGISSFAGNQNTNGIRWCIIPSPVRIKHHHSMVPHMWTHPLYIHHGFSGVLNIAMKQIHSYLVFIHI